MFNLQLCGRDLRLCFSKVHFYLTPFLILNLGLTFLRCQLVLRIHSSGLICIRQDIAISTIRSYCTSNIPYCSLAILLAIVRYWLWRLRNSQITLWPTILSEFDWRYSQNFDYNCLCCWNSSCTDCIHNKLNRTSLGRISINKLECVYSFQLHNAYFSSFSFKKDHKNNKILWTTKWIKQNGHYSHHNIHFVYFGKYYSHIWSNWTGNLHNSWCPNDIIFRIFVL